MTMGTQTFEARPRMLYWNRSMHLEKYTKYAPVRTTKGSHVSESVQVGAANVVRGETHPLREAGTTDR